MFSMSFVNVIYTDILQNTSCAILQKQDVNDHYERDLKFDKYF